MLFRSIVPDVKSRTDLLIATARSSSSAVGALALFKEMRARGDRVDAWMFDALMRACVKEDMHEDAVRLFDEMPGAEVEPDQRVYAVAIAALCKLRDADRALLMLGEMNEAGFETWDFTYRSVVDVLVKAGRMEEALRVKDEMLAAGKKMDVVLATILMHGYCLRREVGTALDLFEESVANGILPTNVTYGMLIRACHQEGMAQKAYVLCCQMKGQGLLPSLLEFNLVIDGLLHEKRWEDAVSLCEEMADSRLLDVFAYNSLIRWLCHRHKLREALS